jgi:hypothetical protein
MIALAAGAQNSKPPATNLNDVGPSTNRNSVSTEAMMI